MTGTPIPTWQECAALGMSQREAAEARGASISAASRAAKNLGLTFRPVKQHTPETRAKISAALLGKPKSPETRAKMSASRRGKTLSPETRAKMSASKLARGGFVPEAEIADYIALRRAGYTRAEALAIMGLTP